MWGSFKYRKIAFVFVSFFSSFHIIYMCRNLKLQKKAIVKIGVGTGAGRVPVGSNHYLYLACMTFHFSLSMQNKNDCWIVCNENWQLPDNFYVSLTYTRTSIHWN